MKNIIVFEKWIDNELIQKYLKDRWINYNKDKRFEYVYVSEDDWEVICDIKITMPWTIKSSWNFKLNEHGFPITEELERNLYDFCLDKTPEDFDIDEAETYVTPLENKKISDIQMWNNLKDFLINYFWWDEIEMKKYDWIWFMWLKNNYFFDFSNNYAPEDELLKDYIG